MSLVKTATSLFLCATFMILAASPAHAFDFSVFRDPQDGALDVSQWILDRQGFLPVPLIITEPAVGYGAGAALLFFHGKKEHGAGASAGDAPPRLPPSISAVVGAYTENDSWFAAGGHFGSWKEDRIRYTGAAGKASLNLKLYLDDNPLSYNIEGVFLYQDIRFRLGGSSFFLGGDYTYFNSSADFDLGIDLPEEVNPRAQDSANAGLGLRAYWDGRDNIFTPGSGQVVDVKVSRFDEAFGGDFDFWEAEAKLLTYHRLHPRLVFGLKVRGETTDGDVPFYSLPFVHLRGIPAMRYQGDRAGDVEGELRWALNGRWSLVAFGGAGWTENDEEALDTKENIVAGGFGFRYLTARRLGMHTGVDIAWGPEDTVIYLQVGSGW